jgi:transposase
MSFYRSKLYSEDECLQYLFDLRFARVRCSECERENSYHRHSEKQCFTCNCGKSHIFPRKGTIFRSSHLPLLTWIHAIFLLTRSKKDVTIHQLADLLNIAYPTAWRMKTMIVDLLGNDALGKGGHVSFQYVMKKCATTPFE